MVSEFMEPEPQWCSCGIPIKDESHPKNTARLMARVGMAVVLGISFCGALQNFFFFIPALPLNFAARSTFCFLYVGHSSNW
jgi:hypothetical protein